MAQKPATAPAARPMPLHLRLGRGMRQRQNWFQLAKFVAVGASGYVVNLGVFSLCSVAFNLHHVAAATIAFLVAVTNNFWWNRHWTFGARSGSAAFQAPRFFAVSVVAFLVQVGILEALVQAGLPDVVSQAISVAAVTPLNFLGNKLWSFRQPVRG
jgi:dolichol-phosphate mannosyltransferase